MALLPQLSSGRAKETSERLRSAVENTSFDAEGKPLSTTVSIGIATFPDEVGNVYELLEKADEALYQCKRAGRNNVISYSAVKSQTAIEFTSAAKKFDIQPGQSRTTDMGMVKE